MGKDHGVWRALLVAVAAVGLVAVGVSAASASPNLSPTPTWQANGLVESVVYSGNTVYIGGSFTQLLPPAGMSGNPILRNHAAAIDATTGTVLSWDPNTDGDVRAIALSPDGSRVYLGGDFKTVGGQTRHHLAAVDPVNGVPTKWHPQTDGSVHALLPTADGTGLYIGGLFTLVTGVAENYLAELTTAIPAQVVSGFQPAVAQSTCCPVVNDIKPAPDGTGIYFVGIFSTVGAASRIGAAEVNQTSGAVMGWNPDLFATTSHNRGLHVLVSGSHVYLCGDFHKVGGNLSPNLASVDPVTGAYDSTFQATTDGDVDGCAVTGTSLYIGGHFQHVGPPSTNTGHHGTGPLRNHLAAVDPTTGAVSTWNPFVDSNQGVLALAINSSLTELAIGGAFANVAGMQQQGFAQFGGTL